DAVELRPVRRDHGEGRSADPARRRLGPRVQPQLKVLRSPYVRIQSGDDHVTMTRRRFAVLLSALVAVNAFFWIAQGGLAVPKALIDRFFGPRMIRAEVIVQGPGGAINDFRLDRGVIVSVARRQIVLREQDGTTVTIAVGPRARVTGSPSVTD